MFSFQQQDNRGKPASQRKSDHLQKLIDTIRSCGVPFAVWENKEGKLDWTALMGGDKKKLLRHLPEKLNSCLPPQNKDQVVKLWKVSFFTTATVK